MISKDDNKVNHGSWLVKTIIKLIMIMISKDDYKVNRGSWLVKTIIKLIVDHD